MQGCHVHTWKSCHGCINNAKGKPCGVANTVVSCVYRHTATVRDNIIVSLPSNFAFTRQSFTEGLKKNLLFPGCRMFDSHQLQLPLPSNAIAVNWANFFTLSHHLSSIHMTTTLLPVSSWVSKAKTRARGEMKRSLPLFNPFGKDDGVLCLSNQFAPLHDPGLDLDSSSEIQMTTVTRSGYTSKRRRKRLSHNTSSSCCDWLPPGPSSNPLNKQLRLSALGSPGLPCRIQRLGRRSTLPTVLGWPSSYLEAHWTADSTTEACHSHSSHPGLPGGWAY